MPWGSKRGGAKQAQQALAAATLGRVTDAGDGADAVRRALARVELERPVRKVAIVDVGAARLAGGIAAALRNERPVAAGPARIVGLDGVDAVIAVVPESLAAADAVAELERVEELLLGVLVVGAAPVAAPVPEAASPDDDDPLAALSELERAAGAPVLPPPTPPPTPQPPPPPPEPEPEARANVELESRLAELEQATARIAELEEQLRAAAAETGRHAELEAQLEAKLAELTQREAALERIRAAVQQREPEPGPEPAEQRGRFGRRRHAAAADDGGRAAELEAQVAALRARIAELEQAPVEPPVLLPPPAEPERPAPVAPVPPPPTIVGRPTIDDLDRLVDDARARGMSEAEEWSLYVPLLREHAGPGGAIPAQFDDLLRDVFGSVVSV